MGETLEAREVAAEELTAPERPVRAVAGAVEDERERGLGAAALGEACSRVRVVVLDADELRVLFERPLGAEVLRVEVVGDRLRLDAEHRHVELEIGAEGAVRRLGVEIAEMCRDKCLAAARDAEGVLELRADCD